MNIKTVPVGFLQTNCYIVGNSNCLIIDPGDEADKIIKEVGILKPVGIIITHDHFDHIGALDEIKNYYNVPVYSIDNLKEGSFSIEDFKFDVIYTKGHTNTSITIYFKEEKAMFTGDFLFKDSIGRTDFLESNQSDMFESIKRIKTYPDDVKIYPGHGEKSDLGYEKVHNYFLQ